MGEREIGDPEDSREAVFHGLITDMVGEDHSDPTAQTFYARGGKVLQGDTNVPDEPLLEKLAVPTLQSEFMVVDNRAAHPSAGRPSPQLCPVSSKNLSASMAAMQPVPAAVMAWR
jgi:hypothetical protein